MVESRPCSIASRRTACLAPARAVARSLPLHLSLKATSSSRSLSDHHSNDRWIIARRAEASGSGQYSLNWNLLQSSPTSQPLSLITHSLRVGLAIPHEPSKDRWIDLPRRVGSVADTIITSFSLGQQLRVPRLRGRTRPTRRVLLDRSRLSRRAREAAGS